MANKPLRDTDAAERMNRLRVILWFGPAAFVILSFAEWKAVGFGPTLLLLMLLNLLFIGVVGYLLLKLVDLGARGWVGMVSGAGNIAPTASFSAQESLIIRGHFADAEQSFRAHLEDHPDDHDARLALADLYRRHLENPAEAERLYLLVRQGAPSRKQEAAASNQLIDLYRATGQRGRLMTELARYAERYAGSRAASEAKRALDDMKQEGERL
jgi:Tetratricopeptide repeat